MFPLRWFYCVLLLIEGDIWLRYFNFYFVVGMLLGLLSLSPRIWEGKRILL